MREIVFRMEMRDCLVGFLIMLALSQGCIDSSNLPGMGPKEVSVDLSTPEGVIEAYWKYLDVGEYDKAYDLYCEDEYFDQLREISKTYSREEFISSRRDRFGENGDKIAIITMNVKEKIPITGIGREHYGIGSVVEEGYTVTCDMKWSNGLNVGTSSEIVKYMERYCIATK